MLVDGSTFGGAVVWRHVVAKSASFCLEAASLACVQPRLERKIDLERGECEDLRTMLGSKRGWILAKLADLEVEGPWSMFLCWCYRVVE